MAQQREYVKREIYVIAKSATGLKVSDSEWVNFDKKAGMSGEFFEVGKTYQVFGTVWAKTGAYYIHGITSVATPVVPQPQAAPSIPATSVEATKPAATGTSPVKPAHTVLSAPSGHKPGCKNDCDGCRTLFDDKDAKQAEIIKRQGAAQHAVEAVYGSPVVAQATVTKNEQEAKAYLHNEVREVFNLLLNLIEGK